MTLSTTPTNALTFSVLGSLSTPLAGGGAGGAEIAGFDQASKRLFVTSNEGLRIVDLSNPTAPALLSTFRPADAGGLSNDVSSVAVTGGLVAIALLNADKEQPGQVLFLQAATGTVLGTVTVGNHPDMVTFTPDGSRLLVANEGEWLNGNGGPGNTPGGVSIIDLSGGVGAATVATAGFGDFDAAALRAEGVRVTPGQTAANDLEPEYIAVSADGTTAMVTLQEANAVGILDIATATFTDVVALGTKDFSTLLADFSDQDGPGGTASISLKTGQPVFGLYMPDAIDSYQAGGQTYYVIANEGDDRNDFVNPDEVIRLSSAAYDLDDTLFPDEATLKLSANLGRLNVVNTPGLRGDTDNDGDIDQILAIGGRSFSILDAAGNIVFDSADIVERITAAQGAPRFDDSRSDNKAAEPEGVEIATIGGRTYAFVGLERAQETLVFDVTDPANVTYTGAAHRPGDLNPEGTLVIAAADSPTGKALYVTTNEESNTVTVFEVRQTADFTLQLLHFSDGEAGLLASQTAPNLAALVDAFDDDYANTLILAGGDNYIPGPFLAAGTDPSVALQHTRGTNPGAADIEIHNRIGVEASTVGNHEFDLGTNAFSDAINDAAFPYLSANLSFSGDSALASRYQETVGVGGLETAASLARKIVPSAVVNKGGELVGLVGATTQIVERISSTGGVEVKGFAGDGAETNDMALLASQLQVVIDDLRTQGVDKIILMAHLQQIGFEQALAPLLSGVDIILAAGSNTRLGDANDVAVAFPGHAADFANTYPIVTQGADGGTTLIVNTDNEYTYLGRLVVEFDAAGNIITENLDSSVNGAVAATRANVAAAWGVAEADLATTAFAEGTKGEQVADITEAVQAVIGAKDGEIWGYTDVYLEGERAQVRSQETNLGNLSANANLHAAQEALADGVFLASLKNGGGIRAQIGSVEVGSGDKSPPLANPSAGKPAGAISTLDIENALRFDNRLMVFDVDAQGLKAIMEFAAGIAPGNGGFMQVGGIRVSFDPDNAPGSKVQAISLVDLAGTVVARVWEDGAASPDAPATISMVSLNFTANGGDGYPIKANASNFRYLLSDGTLSAPVNEALDFTAAVNIPANALGEQQAFKTYLQAFHATPASAFDVADTPAASDTRIQNLNAVVEDTVLLGETRTGTTRADDIDGSAGDDVLRGRAGDDSLAGGIGDDRLLGQAGRDLLEGGNGADILEGQNGDDVLLGGAGNDVLRGGDGDDMLVGGAGDDRMRGGPGADRFVFDGAAGLDRVLDFDPGEDVLDLRGLDFDDLAEVQAAMRQRASGALLTLDADAQVLLVGVAIADLTAADLVLA